MHSLEVRNILIFMYNTTLVHLYREMQIIFTIILFMSLFEKSYKQKIMLLKYIYKK